MKRYLVSILLSILVLASGLGVGCSGVASEPTSTDTQQRIAELEQQVAALAEQVQELSAEDALPSKVIEKDVKEVSTYLLVGGNPELKDRQTLRFQLVAGDRVEGEVSISHINGTNQALSWVRDPYENKILQSASRLRSIEANQFKSAQKYPWRFAFTADTNGEYILEVYAVYIYESPITAHLKVTVYKK